MSFDVNPIKQPLISNTQRMKNDGGGGNLGYMHQGRKNKNEDNEQSFNLTEKDNEDSFQLEEDYFKNDSTNTNWGEEFNKFIKNIMSKIAKFFVPKNKNPFKNISV